MTSGDIVTPFISSDAKPVEHFKRGEEHKKMKEICSMLRMEYTDLTSYKGSIMTGIFNMLLRTMVFHIPII